MSDRLDKSPAPVVELAQLRQALRTSIVMFQNDRQLRRALIHAESAIADRLGERRNIERRSERRKPG